MNILTIQDAYANTIALALEEMYPEEPQRERFIAKLWDASWNLIGDFNELTFTEWLRLVSDHPLTGHPRFDEIVVDIWKRHEVTYHSMGYWGCDPPDHDGEMTFEIRYVGPFSGKSPGRDEIESSSDGIEESPDFDRMIRELFKPRIPQET